MVKLKKEVVRLILEKGVPLSHVRKCGVGELKHNIQINNNALCIQRQSMDAVYNGILSRISGLSAFVKEEYKELVNLRNQIEHIQKYMSALQKKIKAENKFNRQMELNTEVKSLRIVLNELHLQLGEHK